MNFIFKIFCLYINIFNFLKLEFIIDVLYFMTLFIGYLLLSTSIYIILYI